MSMKIGDNIGVNKGYQNLGKPELTRVLESIQNI